LDEEKVIVKVPEQEATELAKKLRHSDALSKVSLSVYAYITKSGTRALHVAIDRAVGRTGKYESWDIRYKADHPKGVDGLYTNAVKRIVAHFNL
jgi:predicted secreted protein